MIENILLSKYCDDGKSAVRLNEVQVKALRLHISKLQNNLFAYEEVPCPVCRSHQDEQISEKDRYGIPMSVVVCQQCGLIRTNPRMTQKSYEDFYATEYRKLYGGEEAPDEKFFKAQYFHGTQILHSIANAGRSILPGMRVVEVGCGAGGILSAFREKGAEVVGCDLGHEFLEFGRKKGLELVNGFLKDIPLSEKKADLIIYSHVLEHVLDLEKELAVVSEALSDNGLLYVEWTFALFQPLFYEHPTVCLP